MNATNTDPRPTPARPIPIPPQAGNCPQGGNHAPIPVQGENYNLCAKCGARC